MTVINADYISVTFLSRLEFSRLVLTDNVIDFMSLTIYLAVPKHTFEIMNKYYSQS